MKRLERLVRLQENIFGIGEQFSLEECDLDEHLYPLLILMNISGYQTTASCGGHEDGKLKCWKASLSPLEYFGGYVDFGCDHEQLTKLFSFLEERKDYQRETDVWFNWKLGVSLRGEEATRHRLSWNFRTWQENLDFIEILECFFIGGV